MIDGLILQLQGEARKAGKALVIISEETIMMEGKGRKLAEIFGMAFVNLLAHDNKPACRQFLTGCGSVVYSAALAGLLEDVEITNLSEALAIARAHKKGREN